MAFQNDHNESIRPSPSRAPRVNPCQPRERPRNTPTKEEAVDNYAALCRVLCRLGKISAPTSLPVQSSRQLERDKSARWSGHQAKHGAVLPSSEGLRSNCRFPLPGFRLATQDTDVRRVSLFGYRDASYVLIWAVLFPRFLSPDFRNLWGHDTTKRFRFASFRSRIRHPIWTRWHKSGWYRRGHTQTTHPLLSWRRETMCFVRCLLILSRTCANRFAS